MARNERYVTTVELNSQQAMDRLKELEQKVKDLKKAKEDAAKSGGFFDEKELRKAVREFNQLDGQIKGIQGILENIDDMPLDQLQKSVRELKKQSAKMLPDSDEWAEKQRQIMILEDRIKHLRTAFRENNDEAERLTQNAANLSNVIKNISGASLNELLQAQKHLEEDLAKGQEGVMKKIKTEQLKEIKARIQEIKAEQQQVVTLMDKYDQEIKQANKTLEVTERETALVDKTMNNISRANVRDLEYSIKIVNEQLRKMDRGTVEFERMQERAKKLRTELERVRYEGAAQQPWINRMANWFNKIQGTVIVGLSSITGLTLTVRKAIQAFADMDQEMENVRKYTGQTTEQVHAMNEEFKQLDTRTSREKLNQLAGDAGRLGIQGREALMEFVDAADKINVALGDDLGENAVKNIGKLSMAFGTDKTMGLRGAMLATGSAVNELSQHSSAAANYLVDFTARVAGFGRQVGLTQTQIMGFGAVMDENMLRDEMAATAFGQLLVKMTTNLDTFARLTGMKVEEYKKLVTEDINGAIIAVAKSLKGRDMQDLGKVFDAMNLDGQRAIGVLATLGDKVDDVQERQRIANEAFEEGTSIIEEYNIQNKTIQADLDRAKKKFNDLRIELGEKLLPIVRYGITTGSAIVNLLTRMIDFIGRYKNAITVLSLAISYLVLKKEADVIVTKLQVLWNEKLATTLERLFVLLRKNPWTAVATAALVVVGIISDLVRKTKEAEEATNRLNRVRSEAAAKYGEEKAKLDLLLATARNENASLVNRKKAIEQLNKIIPQYNGRLDETSKKYIENTIQLNKYLESLAKKFELEGAKDMLKEIGGDIAKATVEIEKMRATLGDDKNIEMLRGIQKTVLGGTYTKQLLEEYDKQNKIIEDAGKARQAIYKAYPELTGVVQEDMDTRASRHLQKIIDRHKKNQKPEPFTDPGDDEKKRKAAEAAAKKLEAQRAKELRDRDKALKAQTEAEIAIVAHRYAQGEIDYREYVREVDRIQVEGFNKRMAIYSEESDEYKRLLNDREQYTLKSVEKQERMKLRDVEREHNMVVAGIEAQEWTDESAYIEALYQADINYLQKKAELFRKGSEERVEIEEEIEDREYQHKLDRERRYQEMLLEIQEQYLNMGNQQQMQIALNGLEELHRMQLLSEEEYQKARIAIQAQYNGAMSPGEQAQKTGGEMLSNARNRVKEYSTQEGGDGKSITGDIDSPFFGTINMYRQTMEQLKVLYANDEESHAAYLAAKQQATAGFLTQIGEEFQAAYNSINQIMSAASTYFSAAQEYETNEVKKKYEKQIEAAGNNQKKVKKLQEKQSKEEAAIKSKYNAKAVKIQIAQALASTAMAAINAYSSASAIPIVGTVLAPIAAAAAIAAGMIQVAAIKKQAAVQEQGYYGGGFTGGNRYRKEAGVVHEGEFVANHQAVNNPNVRTMLDFIDRAQRNNTVGSLKAEDISRQLGQGGSTVVAPVVNVNNNNEELQRTLENVNEAVDGLRDTVEDGIELVFDMDRFDRSYKHYQKLNNR